MTQMSKTQFEAVARAIREARDDYRTGMVATTDTTELAANAALDTASTLLAAELARFNPSFDRARFLAACGMGER